MNNLVYRRKAIVTSVIIVAILCLTSTAVPAIHGLQTNKILDNITKNNIIEEETYEKAIENFGKTQFGRKILNLIKIDLTYEEFIKFYNSIDLPKLSYYNFMDCINTKLMPLRQQLKIISDELEKDENKFKDLYPINSLQLINHKSTKNSPNDDFFNYAALYNETVDFWHEGNTHITCFQEWFDDNYAKLETSINDWFFYTGISFVLCLLGTFFPYISIFGWLVLFYVFIDIYQFIYTVNEGWAKYAKFIINNVEIFIHVRGNTTGEEKDGINDLYIGKNLEAKNIDAINRICDGTKGKTEDLFTYYLGPAKGYDEPGWYTLKNRDIAEGKDKDFKAPPPPGNWTIEVLETAKWKGSGIIPLGFIERDGVRIIEILLEPQ